MKEEEDAMEDFSNYDLMAGLQGIVESMAEVEGFKN